MERMGEGFRFPNRYLKTPCERLVFTQFIFLSHFFILSLYPKVIHKKDMAYNLDKRVNSDARKASNTVFNIGGSLIGCVLGLNSSSKSPKSSGISRKRPKRW